MMSQNLVLVSGASGFVGCHCVQQLLKGGYRVRGTVRSLKNEHKVNPIRQLCPEASEKLELVEADLMKPETWIDAVRGCDYVLHTASPFPAENPRDEDEVIKPAVNGTLNVLKACAKEGSVKRVVVTSSIAAIAMGYTAEEQEPKVFSEEDWSRPDASNITPYEKSKTLAEKAAWNFMKDIKDDENKFELCTICPSFILGPMLHRTECTSAQVVKRVMTRGMPMVPRVQLGCVDVRDVALAHIRAMSVPEAAGQRFLLSERSLWFKDFSLALSKEFSTLGYRPPTKEAPYPALLVASLFDKMVRLILPKVGVKLSLNNEKARQVLGIDPLRDAEKALVEMGHSLIEKGIVPKSMIPQRANNIHKVVLHVT